MDENYVISETEVKEALIGFVAKNCCLRSKPIEKIKFCEIEIKNGYLYSLQSLSEKRETKRKFVPYHGQSVDSAENGEIPEMWEVVIPKPNSFQDGKGKFIVPRSEEVKICHECGGSKLVTCYGCGGMGGYFTYIRDSDGNSTQHWNICIGCGGLGRCNCLTCSGHGQVKWYLQLKVIWKNNVKKCVINETNALPNKLVKKAVGDIVLSENQAKVVPLNNFPDATVKEASIGLINHHQTELENVTSKIVEQKHEVKLVRIAIVKYEYKKKNGNFYVYGKEHLVYFPNYPGIFCYCCSIL